MTTQALARSGFLLAVASIVSCSSGNSVPTSTPVSATPVPPPVSAPVPASSPHTLRGIVFESTAAGRVAVAGVEVYCDGCGSPTGHTFAYTETDGSYSFSWAFDGAIPLLVRKEGYSVLGASGTFPDGTGIRIVTIRGDTQFDIELARR
jgi:hypothetical protein